MFCLYSKGCEYAIRALVTILSQGAGDKFPARDICHKAKIPEAYARKTFQALVQNGFLRAVPGPGGGYSLSRDPGEITLLDVINAVEGRKHFSSCVVGLSACNDRQPCPLHSTWTCLKARMLEALNSRTLREVSESLSLHLKRGKKKSS